MTLIISGTTKTGTTLATNDGPVFIEPTAYLSNRSGGTDALTAPSGTIWSITNLGLILGQKTGIYLDAAGAVANKVAGAIYGGYFGIEF